MLLVTACSSGTVKTWSIGEDGGLVLVGYFNSSAAMSCIGASCVTADNHILLRPYNSLGSLGSSGTGQDSLSKQRSSQMDKDDYSLSSNTFHGDLPDFMRLESRAPEEIGDDHVNEQSLRTSSVARKSPVVNVVVLCGFGSGKVESWNLSNNRNVEVLEASCSINLHPGSVTAVQVLSRHFLVLDYKRAFLSLSIDGSVCLSSVSNDGHISKLRSFFLKITVRRSLVRYINADSDPESSRPCAVEVVCFGDYEVRRLLVCAKGVPASWAREAPSATLPIESSGLSRQDRRTPTATPLLSPGSGRPLVIPLVHGVSASPVPSEMPSLQSELPEDGVDSGEEGGKNDVSGEPLEAEAESQVTFISDVREVSDKKLKALIVQRLYQAKKDPKLLELFAQADKVDQKYISGSIAAMIMEKWLSMGRASADTIDNVMGLLKISQNDSLSFFDVTKLAASICLVLKMDPSNESNVNRVKNRLRKSYREMQTSKTVVKFNCMGEKVVEKVPLGSLAPGIPDGYAHLIRAVWRQQPAKVPSHVFESMGPFPETRLLAIPAGFSTLMPHYNGTLSREWRPETEHWFDLRRTVLVARTILDMRLAAQQEYVLRQTKQYHTLRDGPAGRSRRGTDALSQSMHLSTFESTHSLPVLVTKYFQRTYGSATMKITQIKVLHFLEACLQYAEYPLLNFLKRFLCPEGASEVLPVKCLWLYVEAYNYAKARKIIKIGDLVMSHDTFGGLHMSESDVSMTSGSAALHVNWLQIERTDALQCVDEMYSRRGGYGPGVVRSVQDTVDSFRSVDSGDLYLDLDAFLELISVELNRSDIHISNLYKSLFEEWAIPNTLDVITRRDISSPAIPQVDLLRENVRKSVLYDQLEKLNEFMVTLMQYDEHRSGTIEEREFEKVMRDVCTYLFDSEFPKTIDILIETCIRNFRQVLQHFRRPSLTSIIFNAVTR